MNFYLYINIVVELIVLAEVECINLLKSNMVEVVMINGLFFIVDYTVYNFKELLYGK